MRASVNFILINKAGQKILSRWKEATWTPEGRVFMTTFDEELHVQEGDVLIGEFHIQEELDHDG
jgi:hypothetical protein